MTKAYPYPEIVTGEDWTVYGTSEFNSVPRTDNVNNKMVVPLDRECEACGVNHSRMVRRHQLGRAKWSPKTLGKFGPDVRQEAVEILERMRIDWLLGYASRGITDPYVCQEFTDMQVLNTIYKGSIAELITCFLNLVTWIDKPYARVYYSTEKHLTGRAQWYLSVLNNCADDMRFTEARRMEYAFVYNQVYKFMRKLIDDRRGNLPTFAAVKRQAKLLSILLEMDERPDEQYVFKPMPKKGEGDGKGYDESKQKSGSSSIGSAKDLEKRMKRELMHDMQYYTSSSMGQWGEMRTHEPPLTVNLQARLKNGREYRPQDYGYNPKYINRYCIDKKIFKQRQRVKGGTILIDASGSMRFSGKDILDIMMILPAVNIAMYNGSGNYGDLRIIAKNGLRVSDEYLNIHSGRGNVIDGPALRWLAEQPARRIWVSDMKVFGKNDSSIGYNLLKDCIDICRKAQIINLKDVEEVKEHALKLSVLN
jgi:hypothetical protein